MSVSQRCKEAERQCPYRVHTACGVQTGLIICRANTGIRGGSWSVGQCVTPGFPAGSDKALGNSPAACDSSLLKRPADYTTHCPEGPAYHQESS